MQITEKQKQQLINLNDSRVNEILDLGLKVGEWYKIKDKHTYWLMCYQGNNKGYGFNSDKTWDVDYAMMSDIWVKATKQEIEQALTDEAKRRGFKEGVKFKCLVSDRVGFMVENYFVHNGGFGKGNSLESAFKDTYINGVIFKNGKWAEIIDEKAELKQEIKELEVRLKELRKKL